MNTNTIIPKQWYYLLTTESKMDAIIYLYPSFDWRRRLLVWKWFFQIPAENCLELVLECLCRKFPVLLCNDSSNHDLFLAYSRTIIWEVLYEWKRKEQFSLLLTIRENIYISSGLVLPWDIIEFAHKVQMHWLSVHFYI